MGHILHARRFNFPPLQSTQKKQPLKPCHHAVTPSRAARDSGPGPSCSSGAGTFDSTLQPLTSHCRDGIHGWSGSSWYSLHDGCQLCDG